jgi:hypothetical protein
VSDQSSLTHSRPTIIVNISVMTSTRSGGVSQLKPTTDSDSPTSQHYRSIVAE